MAKLPSMLIVPLVSLLMIITTSRQILAVDYSFENNATDTAGGKVFEDKIGDDYAENVLPTASNFILNYFQQPSEDDRKPVESVDLVLVPSLDPGVIAYVSDDLIRFSAEHLANYHDGDVKKEFTGLIYHEMTHVWQWDGEGEVYDHNRGGLIEGIADFMRMKAGYTPPTGWAQPGQGNSWDQGYSYTARFLEYCEGLSPGFVAKLNNKMRDSYSDGFFQDLLGKTVDQLWSDYKAKFGKS